MRWHDDLPVGIGFGNEPAREIVADTVEFHRAVRRRLFLGKQVLDTLGRKNGGGLLNRGKPLGCILAIVQDIAIGIRRALGLVCAEKGFGHAPENIDLAAGEQARCFRADPHNGVILLEVRGIDQPRACFGDGQAVDQIRRRFPCGSAVWRSAIALRTSA